VDTSCILCTAVTAVFTSVDYLALDSVATVTWVAAARVISRCLVCACCMCIASMAAIFASIDWLTACCTIQLAVYRDQGVVQALEPVLARARNRSRSCVYTSAVGATQSRLRLASINWITCFTVASISFIASASVISRTNVLADGIV